MHKLDAHVIFSPSHTVPPFTWIYRTLYAEGAAKGNELHFHPDTVEVCYIARGHFDWWIGDEAYEIRTGDVVAIHPEVLHGAVDSTLQPCDIYAVHIAPERLPSCLADVIKRIDPRHPGCPELGELVRRIVEEHQRGGVLLPELGAALAVLLLTALDRATAVERNRRDDGLVGRAQAILGEDYGDVPSVEAVARRLGVSSVWLNRSFRQEIGESPGEWIRSRRLAEAKRLLARRRLSVTEVALRLGFTSSQYFSAAFRHHFGMTPTDYRLRYERAWPAGPESAICSPMR